MKTIVMVVPVVALILSGCASEADQAINQSFDQAIMNHSIQQTVQVESKASAIERMFSNVDCTENTAMCGAVKALAAVIGAREISSIRTEALQQERGKTGLDVQQSFVKAVGDGIPMFTVGTVAVTAIREKQGNVTNTSENGDIRNSYEENHATVVGDESSSSLSKTSPVEAAEEEGEEAEVTEEVVEE